MDVKNNTHALSLAVALRTIGRRTEKKNEAGGAQQAQQDNEEEDQQSSSSEDDGEDVGVEASAGDPHLMTKKELKRTFKEHTVDAQAVVTVVADACHDVAFLLHA